ncbi:MAG: bifunctional DNA primase/polymerase [Pseudonocardiaceae bacterium]|nr:MAG: bifunctional DNA primase/polymerase [Pseudonocardiaceae bacterium]
MTNVFAETAPTLIERGYSPLPIRVGSKAPILNRWQECCNAPLMAGIVAAYSRAPAMGIGVACGYANLICVDIDASDLIDPLLEVLPPVLVGKVGRTGSSIFYRGDHPRDDIEWWKKRNYRSLERGLVDFLAVGAQTVIPPTPHPNGGRYRWLTPATLLDALPTALPAFTGTHREAMEAVLRRFGWSDTGREPSYAATSVRPATPSHSATLGAVSVYREANTAALSNLSAWVPKLYLYKLRPKPGGFSAIATWRNSSSGRALEKRNRNLSIVSAGIEDFGTGEKYTAVDLVMAARKLDRAAALNWLLEHLPQEPLILLKK